MQVEVKTNVLAKNDAIASSLQQIFKEKHIFVFNLMGSPGAGKTSLLEATLQDLAKDYNVAVIEGDLFTSKDAERIHALGVPVIQINTVGGCHLDANMIQDAISDLDLDALDMIIIENVGNLVCPAEFDIGEAVKVTVLSVTEGEDKPLKYPLIFKESKAILLNKIDLLPYVPFDKEKAIKDIRNLNPQGQVFEISCTVKDGLVPWLTWLRKQMESR
ncbi:hydrogenase nickel incorporation protein HypB [Veillonella tobetsuensis]|mgnify:FL=1|jgi:hydrogenase accessory protein hypB|uniref:Hydrogenase accessory protein HypB n=1 Tax=Veillonella tobetsuensis TaxID=1110546 RepID=A0A2S7ZPK6_9FIRM|nr:hydrogenase nickel incorporation protein HypB [Veillonella tobetsuensis]MBF1756763.1 hydrogenase nickel incorporation protein HypB [Veillonella tobetsuensis]PQL25223.1 hydrogenase accessory protein HypB [Veillonella tobetsuensis]